MATLAEYTDPAQYSVTTSNAPGALATYVSPSVATLDVSNAVDFHLDVANNDATAPSTLNYDMVFDVTLNEEESAILLNSFTVSNVKIAPDNNNSDTESAVFTTNGPVESLFAAILSSRAVIADAAAPGPVTTPFWAQNDTISDYLNKQLNVYVNGELQVDGPLNMKAEATGTSAARAGLPPASLTMYIDNDSGVATPDFGAAYESMKTTCFGEGGSNALVRQIPASTFIAYDNSENSITTLALPMLKGDTIVIGLETAPSDLHMAPTARTVAGQTGAFPGLPDGNLGDTFKTAATSLKPPSQVLAIRMKLTNATTAEAFTVASGAAGAAGELKKRG
jgi:hypothetical protein